MPWNGTGTFSLDDPPINFQASPISSSDMNSKHADIVAGLNNTILRDGQAAATANLPMATFRHTGVGAAAALTDYARADQVQNSGMQWGGTAGGTANALTLAPSPAITAYAAGQKFRFMPASANTSGTVTVNVSSVGAKNITMVAGPLSPGILAPGKVYDITYDGTNFQLGRAHEVVCVTDYYQVGDTDDTDSFERALAASLAVKVPGNRDYTVSGSNPLEIKDYHCLFGEGMPSAAAGALAGNARITFTGTATSCFANADTGTALLHASISGLNIEATGTYDWMADFNGCIGCDFADMDWETAVTTIGGFRSQKLTGTAVSWVNNTRNFRLRLPNASTKRSWDVDFGDSAHVGNIYGGGLGAIDRGTGGNKYIGCLFNNTSASGAGITFSIEADTSGTGVGNGAQHILDACTSEDNAGYDLLIDGDADNTLTNTTVGLQIIGCRFRSAPVTNAIYAKNTTGGPVLQGLTIVGNTFTSSLTDTINIDRTKWKKVTLEGNTYRTKNFDRLNVGFETNANFTISSGAISIEGKRIFVGTESGAAADNLDTINNGSDGDVIILRTIVDTSRVVTVRDGVGNIRLAGGANCVLTNRRDCLTLEYNDADSEWWEVSRSIN